MKRIIAALILISVSASVTLAESGFPRSSLERLRAVRRADPVVTWASYQVTTTGAEQTHTLGYLTVSAETTVEWGDGSVSNFTGASARTHVYEDADTYTVRIMQPANVTRLQLSENTITVNSADVKQMVNVTDFRVYSCKAGTFNSADVSDWRPTTFYLLNMPADYAGTFDSADVSDWRPTDFRLHSMPANYAGTFDSADVSDWRPTNFRLYSMPADYAGTFDSADVSDWRPTFFLMYSMPANYAGTFDSADVSDWRPTDFYLRNMPADYAGTFNSADVSDWRPTTFYLYSMPSGYAGTFNSADVSDWRPTNFYLYSMPSGYAGTFNSADVSDWRPTNFYLYSMPTATYTFTISANSFKNWTTGLSDFRMQNNSISTAQVDLILWELYQAAQTRTATGGTILLGGNNEDATGVFQATTDLEVSGTTDGAEVAYELREDSLGEGFNTWGTVTINWSEPE